MNVEAGEDSILYTTAIILTIIIIFYELTLDGQSRRSLIVCARGGICSLSGSRLKMIMIELIHYVNNSVWASVRVFLFQA